jgi:flagellar biosynthesis GTPase FlhF
MLREDIGFIDLPGVEWRKPIAVKELAAQLEQFGSPHVHLVLNGAYDISILLAQERAFSSLPIEDLIISHLDEESRWGKVWNLALGTNYSIRHFSTGQNIPGDFYEASAEMVFARQFRCK